jgi:short subunit fatty acids transporter
MIPIVAALVNAGLGLIGNAVMAKGKEVIQDKLGIDLDKSMGTEEGRIKLAELQARHEEFLINAAITKKNQELEEIKIDQANTSDARDMQKEALKQADVFSKRFVYYYSAIWSIVSMTYIFFITFGTIPVANVRFADTILGFLLGTVIATMFNYFLGSSKSSVDKSITIEELKK